MLHFIIHSSPPIEAASPARLGEGGRDGGMEEGTEEGKVDDWFKEKRKESHYKRCLKVTAAEDNGAA